MNETMVCQVCKRPLDYAPGFGWVHGPTDDEWVKAPHDAAPVSPESVTEVDYRCDFCFAPNPGYIVPAKSFDTDAQGRSMGNWMACEQCAGFIRDERWAALTRRAIDAFQRRHGGSLPPEVGKVLARTYVKLKENRIGPVRER